MHYTMDPADCLTASKLIMLSKLNDCVKRYGIVVFSVVNRHKLTII